MQNFPNLTKPFLDPIFDVEPVFEVRFDSKSRLEGVLVKTLRTFQVTPVRIDRTRARASLRCLRAPGLACY